MFVRTGGGWEVNCILSSDGLFDGRAVEVLVNVFY
jgi:hypothetical protein